MKVVVDITEDYIKKGHAGDCLKCPIALALKAIGHGAWVEKKFMKVDIPKGGTTFVTLPREAELFVEFFDKGYDVKPFTFSFTIDQ